MQCWDCVHNYYESDTNFSECTHAEASEEMTDQAAVDECPHYYSKADAKADAKYRFSEKY